MIHNFFYHLRRLELSRFSIVSTNLVRYEQCPIICSVMLSLIKNLGTAKYSYSLTIDNWSFVQVIPMSADGILISFTLIGRCGLPASHIHQLHPHLIDAERVS